MNEKQKRKFGRSLQTPQEKKAGIPWYQSAAWRKRKEGIANRLKKRHEATAKRKAERLKQLAV